MNRASKAARRNRWSLALAIALHLAAFSVQLPQAVRKLAQVFSKPVEEPPVKAIIPVNLPTDNFSLQYQLGSLKNPPKDKKPDFSKLPQFRPKLTSSLNVSQSLHDAADQKARIEAAEKRMIAQAAAQIREQEEFVADITLADSSVVIASKPKTLSVVEQKKLAMQDTPREPRRAKPEEKKPAPKPKPEPPPALAKPEKPRPPEKIPAPEVYAFREQQPLPDLPSPPATLPPLDVWKPQTPDAVETPRLPAAREDVPLAAQFIPGVEPAPDRGPGEFTPSSQQFFSKLTAHLFRANQQALANSVKADTRITLDVRFYIARDGRILGAQVVRSTGNPALDRRAEQVILDASPVPQLADDMPQRRLELSFPVDVYR